MEKKILLLITKNGDLAKNIEKEVNFHFDTVEVNSIHAGYSLALNTLPDVILIDYSSLGLESLKNLTSFKSTHFLNKSLLFLLGDLENRKVLDKNFKDAVDGIIYDRGCYRSIAEEIEELIGTQACLTHYWKDSFMGLFNLLEHPVILLQDEKIVAMNDAFRNDFFITGRQQIKLTDLVVGRSKLKVSEILKKFVRGKHMKAVTKTSLIMNEKIREARITFSKLDKNLSGQMIMMINFTGNDFPLKEEVGTNSVEIEKYFAENCTQEEQHFTKREKEIISLLCKGYKTKEISEALCISAKTIEKHRANIVRRTRSGTILESIVYALNHNMIKV
ncbi:helix-turn-helix transcriptional regulator [Salinimicrobium tongyeongense]|uniref:Helix-turn-helix transcriptional regulator n=1 Tax=Salinimicrobium tongyeongense TaxID=2809707 RepID=A0ABY6NRM4_9FLAO|nr:helix-turn-helix transcriptional regulator [Salinimicrobium tongyeongense]UZH55562.1 helix-turn-helix transcriptional regulator [Salinimicrobium tongyeongense]